MGGVGQVGCGPLWRVDGPLPQAPPRSSLLSVARIVEDADAEGVERWGNGIEVYPYPSDRATAWDASAPGSQQVVKSEGGSLTLPSFGAIVVYLSETCASFGIFGAGLSNEQAQNRFVDRARLSLAAVESAGVEKEFMSGGVLGNNLHLADGNGTFPNGSTVTNVKNGFALLENEIAQSGRAGVIHCTPGGAIAASVDHLLEYDSNAGYLRTIVGTPVVVGSGYAQAHSSPAGKTAATGTQEWMYATGPIDVRRSQTFLTPDNLAQALDRAENLLTYYVERIYVVDWDGVVQAAVRTDRCQIGCAA